jgi:L-ascorbate metabolism protein UlaG (beta-lactamase superfamily)
LGRSSAAVGFVVEGSRGIYFAGDTGFFGARADLGPGLDLALLPIVGWGRKLGSGHWVRSKPPRHWDC